MSRFVPLPPAIQPQGLNCATFIQPPIDGSLTIPEMFDWHAEKSPNHPLFVYLDDDHNVKTITWGEAIPAVHRAGRLLGHFIEEHPGTSARKPLIAFLANTDMITYWAVLAGLTRAGYVPFPISIRNSPGAIAHLLSKTQATHLVVGPEKKYQDLAAAAYELLEKENAPLLPRTTMPVFEDIYKDASVPYDPLPPYRPALEDAALMTHSSGSTAYPKPISFTYLRQLCFSRTICFGDVDFAGKVWAVNANPMFHAMGLVQLGHPSFTGAVLCTFRPQTPAVVPTPEAMIESAAACKADYIFTVPSFVESWASNPEHVRILKSVSAVLWGGGPLAREVGDFLVAQRVNTVLVYGLSEFGVINKWIPAGFNEDWEYFSITPEIKVHLIPASDGMVQLVIPTHAEQIPAVTNTVIDGVPAYDTNDLLAPHPTKPGLWKVFGRADDQIMHSTGEKTNPGPLENILRKDPHVNECIMFGRSRFNAGVLVDPKPEFQIDPTDESLVTEFRNKIWPSVEKMNDYAPQHSRVFKEMILISSPSKPFTYTAKGTLRRQAIINEYEPEINSLYDAVEQSTQSDLNPPSEWTTIATEQFVREVINKVMEVNIGREDDLFRSGCDSLQATWIRNSLLRALKVSKVNVRAIPNNFVYQYPTIAGLSAFISGLASGVQDSPDTRKTVVKAMEAMVDKYTHSLPAHRPQDTSQPSRHVYLVTGTTGGLGCALLAYLAGLSNVERIYAVNRPSKTQLKERQEVSLKDRGYDVQDVMTGGKVILLEAVTEDALLGIDSALYEEMRSTVTHIVHNAWPVNFNWALQSFEPSIKGLRHLVDLALASPHPVPPRLLFTSSVGVLRNVEVSEAIREAPVSPTVAAGSGYSESKWVGERLLEIVAKDTPMHTVSVRVGQLSGSVNGAWNHTDWLPSLVKSSVYLGCMPTMDKEISWIPVDAAARAITEMIDSEASVLHLIHPRPVSWASIMEPLAESLGLSVVPFEEWVSRLQKSGNGLTAEAEVNVMRQNPALKIADMFVNAQAAPRECKEALGIPPMDMSQAVEVSRSLTSEHLPQTCAEEAMRWISYWKGIGFI